MVYICNLKYMHGIQGRVVATPAVWEARGTTLLLYWSGFSMSWVAWFMAALCSAGISMQAHANLCMHSCYGDQGMWPPGLCNDEVCGYGVQQLLVHPDGQWGLHLGWTAAKSSAKWHGFCWSWVACSCMACSCMASLLSHLVHVRRDTPSWHPWLLHAMNACTKRGRSSTWWWRLSSRWACVTSRWTPCVPRRHVMLDHACHNLHVMGTCRPCFTCWPWHVDHACMPCFTHVDHACRDLHVDHAWHALQVMRPCRPCFACHALH